MPNPHYNNMHGANRKQGDGASNSSKGSSPASIPEKTANWPGVAGKTQSKDRSAGVSKTGHCGPFDVVKKGI